MTATPEPTTALTCPVCHTTTIWGPAEIIVDGESFYYYDCGCCHHMLLVMPDGSLSPRAGAW